MRRRIAVLLAFCYLIISILTCGCAHSEENLWIEWKTWESESLPYTEPVYFGSGDQDKQVYLRFFKEAEMNLKVEIGGRPLTSADIQVEWGDPSVVEVIPNGDLGFTLKWLKPESRDVDLFCTYLGARGQVRTLKITLVVAKWYARVVENERQYAFDLDNGDSVNYTEWSALAEQSRPRFDLILEGYFDGVTYPAGFYTDCPYGYLELPKDMFNFAGYSFYPESSDLPRRGNIFDLFDDFGNYFVLIESSEGTIFKVAIEDYSINVVEMKRPAS